jgi:hypothetical protein
MRSPGNSPKALGKRKWWSKSAKCFCNHTANLVIEMSSKGHSAKCFGKHHKYLFSLKPIWANWKDFTDTIRSHHNYCKFLYTFNFKSILKKRKNRNENKLTSSLNNNDRHTHVQGPSTTYLWDCGQNSAATFDGKGKVTRQWAQS